MPRAVDIQDIIAQIKKLGEHEQMTLLNKLVLIVRKQRHQKLPLTTICGIGADIWRDTDIDKYIESEREW